MILSKDPIFIWLLKQKNQKLNEKISKKSTDAPQASSSANSIYTINEDLSVTIDMVTGDQNSSNLSGLF